MGYSNRFRPKGEAKGVTVPMGRRLEKLSDTHGRCNTCGREFIAKSAAPDLQQQFDAHNCKKLDSSQNALRIVREATENK